METTDAASRPLLVDIVFICLLLREAHCLGVGFSMASKLRRGLFAREPNPQMGIKKVAHFGPLYGHKKGRSFLHALANVRKVVSGHFLGTYLTPTRLGPYEASMHAQARSVARRLHVVTIRRKREAHEDNLQTSLQHHYNHKGRGGRPKAAPPSLILIQML